MFSSESRGRKLSDMPTFCLLEFMDQQESMTFRLCALGCLFEVISSLRNKATMAYFWYCSQSKLCKLKVMAPGSHNRSIAMNNLSAIKDLWIHGDQNFTQNQTRNDPAVPLAMLACAAQYDFIAALVLSTCSRLAPSMPSCPQCQWALPEMPSLDPRSSETESFWF